MILQLLPTVLNHFPHTYFGVREGEAGNPGKSWRFCDHTWWSWEGDLEPPGCRRPNPASDPIGKQAANLWLGATCTPLSRDTLRTVTQPHRGDTSRARTPQRGYSTPLGALSAAHGVGQSHPIWDGGSTWGWRAALPTRHKLNHHFHQA